MSVIVTKEIVNQRLRDQGRNITLIGEYTKQKNKTLFRCEKDHEWTATPDNVLRLSGCPICEKKNHRVRSDKLISSKDEVNEYLSLFKREIILVGEYTKSWTPALFECRKCYYQWMARPNNIKSGKGCPKCSSHGFNPDKPAWTYVFERSNYIKYGITNNLEQRLGIHRKYGNMLVHYSEYHSNGIKAKEWEDDIKTLYGGNFVSREECPDGWTETLSKDYLGRIVRRR